MHAPGVGERAQIVARQSSTKVWPEWPKFRAQRAPLVGPSGGMKVPYIVVKIVRYLTLTVALCGYGGWVLAHQEANESTTGLRTELKAALAPPDDDANQADQT